ncbi:MAG: transglutaminase domain-containing protein [Candidatus Shapirobacteria bacterium]
MIISLAILFLLLNTTYSRAINEFKTSQEISYQFSEESNAQVEHQISIINNFSQFYPTEYSLSLTESSATDIQAFDTAGIIPIITTQNNNEIKISLKLINPKVGKDQNTTFKIRYRSNGLVKKKGKTWEISIPQFQDNLSDNININLKIPISFGKLSSSPLGATISTDSQNTTIEFTKFNQTNKLILTFGEYQLFDFNLNYHLQNSSDKKGIFTIPIPPDTSTQKIIFNQIDPSPQKIENDIDGNLLAFYTLDPQSNINITASGQAKIGQNHNYKFQSKPNLSSQLYWPVDNLEIQKLAKIYTTPKQIYDYVISTLKYDYKRVNNSARRGALAALSSPETSLCTDFTDLFVSIARAAGIGAREIEGYAYSNNATIKPLSIGTDILHAWPEYFDTKSQKWIPIDPTWGNTTGGINYFDDLDLNHFSFVIHNQQSDSPPPPGSYKSDSNIKSVDINFADNELFAKPVIPNISVKFNPFSQSYLVVNNPNLFSLDNLSVQNSPPTNLLPLATTNIKFPKTAFIKSLWPQNQKIPITIASSDFTTKTIYIQNPYHFLNLFITIITSLIILSFGAIILLRHK